MLDIKHLAQLVLAKEWHLPAAGFEVLWNDLASRPAIAPKKQGTTGDSLAAVGRGGDPLINAAILLLEAANELSGVADPQVISATIARLGRESGHQPIATRILGVIPAIIADVRSYESGGTSIFPAAPVIVAVAYSHEGELPLDAVGRKKWLDRNESGELDIFILHSAGLRENHMGRLFLRGSEVLHSRRVSSKGESLPLRLLQYTIIRYLLKNKEAEENRHLHTLVGHCWSEELAQDLVKARDVKTRDPNLYADLWQRCRTAFHRCGRLLSPVGIEVSAAGKTVRLEPWPAKYCVLENSSRETRST